MVFLKSCSDKTTDSVSHGVLEVLFKARLLTECHVVAAAVCGLVQAAQLTMYYTFAAASMALHMAFQAMTLQALNHFGRYSAKRALRL